MSKCYNCKTETRESHIDVVEIKQTADSFSYKVCRICTENIKEFLNPDNPRCTFPLGMPIGKSIEFKDLEPRGLRRYFDIPENVDEDIETLSILIQVFKDISPRCTKTTLSYLNSRYGK